MNYHNCHPDFRRRKQELLSAIERESRMIEQQEVLYGPINIEQVV